MKEVVNNLVQEALDAKSGAQPAASPLRGPVGGGPAGDGSGNSLWNFQVVGVAVLVLAILGALIAFFYVSSITIGTTEEFGTTRIPVVNELPGREENEAVTEARRLMQLNREQRAAERNTLPTPTLMEQDDTPPTPVPVGPRGPNAGDLDG